MPKIITIDGPSGAGKTTVASIVAIQTKLPLLASGKLFRAVAWNFGQHDLDVTNGPAVNAAIEALVITYTDDGRVLCDGIDATDHLYQGSIGLQSAQLATIPAIRRKLLAVQRDFGMRHGCVTEGVSTAIEVFPEADLKIWLTADPATRYQRLLLSRGQTAAEQMLACDTMDTERSLSPMKKEPSSIEIDTTDMTADEAAQLIIQNFSQLQQ